MPRQTLPLPDISSAQRRVFEVDLLGWFARVRRDLPWRRTKDSYRIWISEIMLQQTRVDQAQPYYERFLRAFPDVATLAQAPLDDVLKAWEGLGYYSRARNLHKAARRVVADFGGALPDTYEGLRALPGIGPYTAAAIASIAFGLPHAVLDGNVIRVLTRAFALDADARTTKTKKMLQALADELIPPAQPAAFNEAIMELGATVCRPRAPLCVNCPIRIGCHAFAQGTPEAFPVVAPKPPSPHYDIAIGLVSDAQGRLLIQRRAEDGLLGGLWEFPGGKQEPDETLPDACARELWEELGIRVEVGPQFIQVPHAYTHFKVTLHAFPCRITDGTPISTQDLPMAWVALEALDEYAFPRANRRIIDALMEARQAPSLFAANHLLP